MRLRQVDLPGRPNRTVFTAMRESSAQHPAVAAVRRALVAEAAALSAGRP
jgi:hypothetical protein